MIDSDREGPEISYTFRLEGVDAKALEENVYDPMPLKDFPADDYVVISEKVMKIFTDYHETYEWERIGLLRLKGFHGYHDLYLLRNVSGLPLS